MNSKNIILSLSKNKKTKTKNKQTNKKTRNKSKKKKKKNKTKKPITIVFKVYEKIKKVLQPNSIIWKKMLTRAYSFMINLEA